VSVRVEIVVVIFNVPVGHALALCAPQVKGSAVPIELYGFDVDWANIPKTIGEDVFNQKDDFVDDRLQEPKVECARLRTCVGVHLRVCV
jgi:hypothetical protein